jgi:hypothetical protein
VQRLHAAEVDTLRHTKYNHMAIDGAIFGATIQK